MPAPTIPQLKPYLPLQIIPLRSENYPNPLFLTVYTDIFTDNISLGHDPDSAGTKTFNFYTNVRLVDL